MTAPASLLLALIALPFMAALLLCAVPNTQRRLAAWIAGIAALLCFALVMMLAPSVFAGQVPRAVFEWVPALGLNFSLRVDGLAWMFALLVSAIGALVVLYAAYYLDKNDPAARFFCFLMLFMGAMLGVVLSGNLLLLVVFWELTGISSFLLIGYWHQRSDAREGARMALVITGAGGLCLLAGVLLIGHIAGSFELDVVLAAGNKIRAHAWYVPALVLVLLGAFTKSAQFPFHFWLPHAMAAPTPVSAYLHSATMVKCGVFLLARMYPALGSSEPWFWIVSLTGLVTLIVGAYIAIFQHDLKGLLAYSTISHLGLITMLFGLDEPLAVVAGVFHILNHATFKAGLFMAAGIIDHETGSRDMRNLNGLMKTMPITGVLAIVASLSMAGVPLFNGFLSKEMFFAETLAKEGHAFIEWLLPLGATLAGILSVAYSLRFIHDVFFNDHPIDLPKVPHEPPRFMRLPVEALVLICLAVGLVPAYTIGPVLALAAQAALFGAPGAALPAYKLAIWHGFNLPLLMSAIALGGGILLYFSLQRFVNLHTLIHLPFGLKKGGRDAFMWKVGRLTAITHALTGFLENGRLQRYLFLLVLTSCIAAALPWLLGARAAPGTVTYGGVSLPFVLVWCIGMAAAVGTVMVHRNRILALVLLGATGLAVALAFVYFSAPDLALTQLLVEVATLILMMLALHWLPQQSAPEPRAMPRKLRDAGLATLAGLGVAALVYMVLSRPFDSISPYFLRTTVPEGGGANAVNVIIVDYRGFDTLGEITVLGIAALLIYALLHRFTPATDAPAPVHSTQAHPLMLALVARLLLPFAALIAIYFFLRGHNLPGGGFIAGLVLAIALLLQFAAHGQAWMQARMSTDFRGWIGWGLLIATLTGMGSWLFAAPFLTSTYDYPVLPWIGPVPLASASLFDLGVFLTVVGATVVALLAIGMLTRKAGDRTS
jgi:multicomponent K+:H+ antiporter subunit A